MSKIVFSQTERFIQIRDAVTDICVHAAIKQVFNKKDIVEDYIDAALPVLEYAFPEVECFGDTDTRRAAKIAVYEVLENAKSVDKHERYNFIEENIDCSMVMNDILHMVTCDSDEYEYEGSNSLFEVAESL